MVYDSQDFEYLISSLRKLQHNQETNGKKSLLYEGHSRVGHCVEFDWSSP
jgi:hypothetical protein